MKLPPETASLLPARSFDRRDFVRVALGSGFAAAVLPVAAQTVSTPDSGLKVGEEMIKSANFNLPVYVARPAQVKGWLPIVLVVSEIFGVHEHIADVCRRFAQQGYLALAPELFARQGDPSSLGTIQEILTQIVAKVPDAQVMADLDACIEWAAANGGDLNRSAITGFCWGGRITWLYASHSAHLKAGVAWYGRLVGNATSNTPSHPLDVASRLQAPVLGLYGGKDEGIPLDTVEQMKVALAKGGKAARASELVVYADAPHAFHADYRASYRAEAAKDGWQRALDWLRKHGVA